MKRVNSGTAYVAWCLCFFGIFGVQRFYTGKIAIGLIYFFTFGLFGIGQLLDLILIPDMVDRRNRYLRRLGGENSTDSVHHSITLNLSDIPQLQQFQANQAPTPASGSPMLRLLRAAKENGGTLSIAQAAMYTELEPQDIKQLLQEAERHGFAEIGNDPNSGAIRYHFDV
jgi:TM2 domain-containing membrane protein YozV